jgi:hypothetical protein
MEDEVTWMLDFDASGHWPVRAHEIVAVENPGHPDEVRVTACGYRAMKSNHPRGWWGSPRGEMPLSGPDDIHCHT